jgi:hypothetical protein
MVVGHACALCKTTEAESGVGGIFTVETEQLTHGVI